MSESNDGLDHPILKLSPAEKAAYSHLFALADSDSLGVVTGERAVSFFEKTHVPAPVLGEIWQVADTENRGLLTKPGFCMVLRLIGWWQNGQQQPSAELAFKPAPIPKFDGITLPGPPQQQAAQSPTTGGFPANALQPQLSGQSSGGAPIRVPPLDPAKVQQYSGLFDRSGAQNGLLDGATAKSIFERAGLQNETLGKIWMLSDREQRGGLDQTEFIVAMHLLTSMKTRAMAALPTTLPQGLWDAAARRGQRPPSRQMSGAAAVPRQFTGNQSQVRTQSPLARPPGYGTPPPQHAQPVGTPWIISQQEKSTFDQFFSRINPSPTGLISGEQAVGFFSNSGLSEETLAQIWDLADIDSDGQLSRDEFAVAMYLIKQQRSPNAQPLPAFLPTALVPPSMRGPQQQQQVQQQQQQHTPVPQKPSAADDLFGLDSSPTQPSQAQQATLQPQSTGASASRDPFSGSPAPGSPSSPARFQQQQSTGGVFKQFVPTSAFGASLAQQHTGASSASSQPQMFTPSQSSQATGSQQQQQQQPWGAGAPMPSTTDDLLGDSEAGTAESSRLTNDTTELANMSNQIGNLRTQMEATQAKKSTTQADLASTNAQKTDLEQRLQQFRAQYETEVRTVKELETQLAASRASTKQLSQELAMLEGTYQDLSTQHRTVSQQLQADQQENANLKQRISQMNAEVARMKPEIEKMKLDARQQKGMVSINKKQLATNEGERDRLATEKADLEREAVSVQDEASSRAISPEPSAAMGLMGQASNVASPSAGSAMSSTNPFFRNASGEGTGAVSPPSTGPTPSAFDALFGPSSHFAPGGQVGSRTGTPPATSFIGRNLPTAAAAGAGVAGVGAAGAVAAGMTESASSADDGEATPAATPPLSQQTADPSSTDRDAFLGTSGAGSTGERDGQLGDSPVTPLGTADIPPPPPESRQFTPTNLPLTSSAVRSGDDVDAASSTKVIPPASNLGDAETPGVLPLSSPGAVPEVESIPGSFPEDGPQPNTVAQEIVPSNGESSEATPAAAGSSNVNDDFDAAFAGFGAGKPLKYGAAAEDPFASAAPVDQKESKANDEFPPIQSFDDDDSDSSEDDDEAEPSNTRGFEDSFTASDPSQSLNAPGEFTGDPVAAKVVTPREELPDISKQSSPPTYDQSNDPSHGGHGDRTSSNQFPPEWGGLLPAREDPTASPPPATSPPVETESAVREVPTDDGVVTPVPPPPPQRTSSLQPSAMTDSSAQPLATPTTDVFVDASSRPMSSVTDAGFPLASSQPAAPDKNGFDDFDEFDDLAEAKEADKSSSNDFDFGFGNRPSVDEFNPAFDSPAASNTATPTPATRSVQQSQDISTNGNAFADFTPNVSGDPFGGSGSASNGTSSIQQTPQRVQHDWDAIFSGLDSSKDLDTSFGDTTNANADPWAPTTNGNGSTSSATATAPSTSLAPTTSTETTYAPPPGPPPSHQAKNLGIDRGGAITPGTEHDDPILKRLTGMGYPRTDALTALEMFDYDINKAVDHLAGA